jgi:hypothetical protein
MTDQPEIWTLHRDGAIIAELRVTGRDMPSLSAAITRLAGFEAIEPFFTEDLEFLELPDPDGNEVQRWEELSDRYLAGTTLHHPSGAPAAEFLLHIDGDVAWWRWSDAAFD